MNTKYKKDGEGMAGSGTGLPFFVETETDMEKPGAYKWTMTCLSTTLTASMVTLSALVINM